MNSRVMRWYGLPVLVLAALLFMMLAPQPVFAAPLYTGGSGDGFTLLNSSTMDLNCATPTWESYKEEGHDNVWGDGGHYDSSFNTAYIYGGNFTTTHTYSVGFYDADGDKAATDVSSNLTGSYLSAQCLLSSDPARAAGTWHAVTFDTGGGSPPTTYAACSGAAGYVVEDDFNVDAGELRVCFHFREHVRWLLLNISRKFRKK